MTNVSDERLSLAKAFHDGPLMASDHQFDPDSTQGKWCLEVVNFFARASSRGEPVAWRYRERGTTLWSHAAETPVKDEWGNPDWDVQPLYASPAEAVTTEALRQAGKNLLPYLEWTIGDESPGYHPTMPSAVDAFRSALTASPPLLRDREIAAPLKALEDNCWDLRCVTEPTNETGCSDVSWVVIGRFMEAPTERMMGSGDTPLEAIHNAIHLVKS